MDVVAPIRDRLAPGSAIVISHLSAAVTDTYGEDGVSTAKNVFRARAATETTLRTDEQIAALLGAYRLMAPGLVPSTTGDPN